MNGRRILAVLLALVLTVTAMPMDALAAGMAVSAGDVHEGTGDAADENAMDDLPDMETEDVDTGDVGIKV